MLSQIIELLPILRCPRTHTALHLVDGRLISEAGEEYPIVDGKPVLVKLPRPHHLSAPAPEHIRKTSNVI